MITRLYADNFKTLVNFELPLGAMNLLLGANGSGKSTVLETIRLIKSFVCEDETSTALFPTSSLCRWDARKVQTFEIDLLGKEEEAFIYKIEIEHEVDRSRCRIKSECLSYSRKTLYSSKLSDNQLVAKLYHDDGNPGPEVLCDWNRSGVGRLQPRHDNQLLTTFRKYLENVLVAHINPDRILVESEAEDVFPNADMSNFVAWYRHLSQAKPTQIFQLTEVLKNVLDGFLTLYLPIGGEKSRSLWAEFGVRANDSSPETKTSFRFSELSDGQQSLVILYTLATCVMDEENMLCLDHPETYLALPEIQPWLLRLADATEEGRCQAIVATHHPELINLLAANSGYWLERQSGGPTRVRKIAGEDASGLPLSELIARGWLHG